MQAHKAANLPNLPLTAKRMFRSKSFQRKGFFLYVRKLSVSARYDECAAPKEKGKREYRKTGLLTLKRALIDLGSKAIDGRSSVGVALRRWKADLVQDLGGDDSISTQQETLIELAVRSKIMLDSIDACLLTQPSLINASKRTLIPLVLQRQTLADGLARYLSQLGLERRRKVKTLQDLRTADPNTDKPATVNGDGKAD